MDAGANLWGRPFTAGLQPGMDSFSAPPQSMLGGEGVIVTDLFVKADQ